MKKVYLKAYSRNNLGDDLFIYYICKRYKNKFTIIYNRKPPIEILNCMNLKIKKDYLSIFLNKLFNNKYYLSIKEYLIKKKNDCMVYIGGSIFIQKKNYTTKNLKEEFKHKELYIIGSNFGPYKSTNYYKDCINIYKKANDVCFRDFYSYNLFKNIHTCRYEPDILYSFDYNKYISKKTKKIVTISIINCENRDIEKYKEKYENFIIDIIKKYTKQGYSINCMSFCKAEGDEEAIQRIISKINDKKIKEKIRVFNYKDSIENALYQLGQSEIIVGSRFHANIIGMSMNKTIIPIAYSDKTINALKDINYSGTIIDIRKLNNTSVFDPKKIKKINYCIPIKKSVKQFEKLDQILEVR